MRKRIPLSGDNLSLEAIAEYHNDCLASLGRYYNFVDLKSNSNKSGYSKSDVKFELYERVSELDKRSCLAVLACIEASFRVDAEYRIGAKRKDSLSKSLQKITRDYRNLRFEEDILEAWKSDCPEFKGEISALKSAFKFRHWLAHGRYWVPKLGRQYDYLTIYDIAQAIIEGIPLEPKS